MPDTPLCPSCGTDNKTGAKFCRACGAMFGAAADQVIPDAGGFISNGTWARPPEELIRLVPRGDLKGGLFKAGVQVPRGTIGVIVSEGAIVERLRPGFRTTESVVDRFVNLFNNKLDNTSVYLIDLRPIFVPLEVEAQSGGSSTRYEVIVDVNIPNDDARLLQLLATFVRDKESVSSRDVYNELRPRILAIVEPRLSAQRLEPGQRAAVESEVQRLLQASVGDTFGFEVGVSIGSSTSSTTVDVHVGEAATPATKKCIGCAADIESSRKFCGKCGVPQPVMTQPGRSCGKCGQLVPEAKKFCGKCGEEFVPQAADQAPIYTADGQQIEAQIVVRAEGKQDTTTADRLKPLIASAVSQHVRTRKFDDIASVAGFAELEKAIRDTVTIGARALGLDVTEVTLLDVRSKGKEWLLGARAELDRAIAGIEVGREWVAADMQGLELEGMQLNIKGRQLDLALRRQQLDRDHTFSQRTAELDDKERNLGLDLRDQRMDQDQAFAADGNTQADRERRQQMRDAAARLDVVDTNRQVDVDLGIDSAERRQNRAIQREDHADALAQGTLSQERQVQTDTFERENETSQIHFERARDTEEIGHRREQESVQARHEMGLEREVVKHDGAIAREAMELGSERIRRDLDDRGHVARAEAETGAVVSRTNTDAGAYSARSQADTSAYAYQTRNAAERDDVKARSDIAFDDEARREKLKTDKMRQLAEMDALLADGDAGRASRAAQQAADNELRSTEAASATATRLAAQEQDHSLKMRQELKGQSAEQMLGMQLEALGNTEKGADVLAQLAAVKRAEAEATGGAAASAMQKEMYERMMQMQAEQ